jgi:putative ABC transport system permease protein
MRFYRALLHLYPKSVRAEYGEEMCSVYAHGGVSAMGAALEVLRNAPAAHFDILRQDLRHTFRTLLQTPGFTVVAILVLALGIGANTVVFSITDFALIRALPYPSADRLVKVWQDQPGYRYMELSPANYRDWKQMNAVFEDLAAFTQNPMNLVGEGNPERIDTALVSGNFFRVLGVAPLYGRSIVLDDDREGTPLVAVLSYALFQSTFGGDPAVLGRKINLDGRPYVVVGIMPPQFRYPDRDVGLWAALQLDKDNFVDRNDNWLDAIARLRPRTSLRQAQAGMNVVADQLRAQYPKELKNTGAVVVTLNDEISQQSRLLLTALSGAALCVLFIACLNLASLLLARALSRQKELSIRSALGAGRERLIRQLVTESLVLASAGGALGLMVAKFSLPLLTKLAPSVPASGSPGIDVRVLAFAAIVTLFTGVAFGVFPAWQISRNDAIAGLRERSAASGGQRAGLRSALILAEISLSVVLLIFTGLLLRALFKIQSVDPGFRTEGVVTLRTPLPMPKYEDAAKREAFFRKVLTGAEGLPGVADAAYISYLPMTMTGGIWPVDIDGKTVDRSEGHTASLRFITPGFFSTLAIPLRQGRVLTESDAANRPLVAVVSESFARRYWPDQNPLGRHFKFALAGGINSFADRTVVGLVGDIRVRGLNRVSEPQVYLPYTQQFNMAGYTPRDLAIRASGDPALLIPALRRIIHEADPDQPVILIRSLAEIVTADTASRSLQARMLAVFAALALLLAGLGIHGLLSFTVSSRSGELAIRMALGAQRRDILGIVLNQSLVLAIAGVTLGAGLAYAAARPLQALLAGIAPTDPVAFAVASGLCVLMTLAGSLLPAIRALRVDPIAAIHAV